VFNWRNSLVLGAFFTLTGIAYLFLQGDGLYIDRAGATMLIVLGVGMAFGFAVLLRVSREL
jgi:hypothetical protein